MKNETGQARIMLLDALDDAADLVGVPTVMAWCMEWEAAWEESREPTDQS